MNETLPCGLIRDLLPLYAEGLAGPESRAAVEEHLCSCEECRKALAALQTPPPRAAAVETAPLQKVRASLQKRRRKTAALAVCLALAAAAAVFARVTAPEYLSYGAPSLDIAVQATAQLRASTEAEAAQGLAEREALGIGLAGTPLSMDGTALREVCIVLGGEYHNYRIEQYRWEEDGQSGADYYIWALRYPLELPLQEERTVLELDASETARVYFVNADGSAVLLWQNVEGESGGAVPPQVTLEGQSGGTVALSSPETATEGQAVSAELWAWQDADPEVRSEQVPVEWTGLELEALYFCNADGSRVLLWQYAEGGGMQVLPRLALGYYVLLAAPAALLLGALLLIFRRRKTARRVLYALFCLPVCYLGGHLLVKGLSTLSTDIVRDLALILLAGGCLYAASQLAGSLKREK